MGKALFKKDNWFIVENDQGTYEFYIDRDTAIITTSASTLPELYTEILKVISKAAQDLIKMEEEFRLKAPGFFREAVKEPTRRAVDGFGYSLALEGRDTESIFGRQGFIAVTVPGFECDYAFFTLPSDPDCPVYTVETKVRHAIQEITDKLHVRREILDSTYKSFNRFLKAPEEHMRAYQHEWLLQTLPTSLLEIQNEKSMSLFDKSSAMTNRCQEFINQMKEYGIVPEEKLNG